MDREVMNPKGALTAVPERQNNLTNITTASIITHNGRFCWQIHRISNEFLVSPAVFRRGLRCARRRPSLIVWLRVPGRPSCSEGRRQRGYLSCLGELTMPAARMADDRDSVLLLRLLVGESRPLKSGIKFIRTSSKGSAGPPEYLTTPIGPSKCMRIITQAPG